MKIRAYLLMMGLAVLVPIIIFSAISLQMLLGAERRAALRSLHETARATALIVDRELSSAEAALRVLASSPHLASGDMTNFYEHATTADRGEGGRTILFAPNGQQLINTVVPLGTPLPPPPVHVQERTRRVIESQETVVSDLIIGAVQRAPVTTINVPVPIEYGQRYVLASVFDTNYFQTLISQYEVPATWRVAVLDRNGVFIAATHDSSAVIGHKADEDLINAAHASSSGELRHKTSGGLDSYDAFTHSAMSGWTIAVAAPTGEIEAAAQRAVAVAALGLLAAMICAAGAAWLFGRRLVRSISRAKASAAALARGEAPEPERSGVAEVDQLHLALKDAGTILIQSETERMKLLHSEQEARRQAEEQNRLKDEFLAMLGHELRNPLSAIVGAIEIMEAEGADADSIRRARAILGRQSDHLSRIVDDLLDLARLSTGKIKLDLRPVDLASVAEAAVEALQASGRTEHAITVHAESAWINADRTRLEQIVNNLLANAFKYTPAGGEIDVRVSVDASEAVFAVHDSGVGIQPELMPRLFDIFVQGSVSLDRTQGGLGIGLSLVRELVMLHGGTVRADSPGAGLGSTFTVRFPLADRAVEEDSTVSGETAGAGRLCQVLLIEDNEDARQIVSARLRMKGYKVLEAANGTDGIRLAVTEKPTVAIIDIGLPGMDGYEIARHLRADPATRAIWLIALTGYGQVADRQRALEAGFNMHQVKPVGSERLIEMIQIYCARVKGVDA